MPGKDEDAMNVPISKIEQMLKVYRARLEKINEPPIAYVEGIRVSAAISILEDLYYYALQQPVEPAQAAQRGEAG
jgi:hypothetical protein